MITDTPPAAARGTRAGHAGGRQHRRHRRRRGPAHPVGGSEAQRSAPGLLPRGAGGGDRPRRDRDSTRPAGVAARIDRPACSGRTGCARPPQPHGGVHARSPDDCGDPRSDVDELHVNPGPQVARPPGPPPSSHGDQQGTRPPPATAVHARSTSPSPGGAHRHEAGRQPRPRGDEPCRARVDLRGLACGTKVSLKASTQSDFHRHRVVRTSWSGPRAACRRLRERRWLAGQPGRQRHHARRDLGARHARVGRDRAGRPVQPDGARGSARAAFVTGLPARSPAR